MNARDYFNALRMTWHEVRPTAWTLFLLPALGLFYFRFVLLTGPFLLMIFYIMCFVGASVFFPPVRVNTKGFAFPMEFAFTRAVSRSALHAAKTTAFLLYFLVVYAGTALLALRLGIPIPHLSGHLALALGAVLAYQAFIFSLWPHPRARMILGNPGLFGGLIGGFGGSTRYLFDLPFAAHPFLVPAACAVGIAAVFLGHRSFTRQEIL